MNNDINTGKKRERSQEMNTEKQVVVIRHGPKESGPRKDTILPEVGLSAEGRELMERTATFFKEEDVAGIRTSPLVRCYQSGMIFSVVLGKDYPIIMSELCGDVNGWIKVVPETVKTVKNPTVLDFYNTAPQFIEEGGENLFKAICKIAEPLPTGKKDICISHGGLIEPAMIAAIRSAYPKVPFPGDSPIPTPSFSEVYSQIVGVDLKEGERVAFKFDEDNKFIGLGKKQL